jgi:hypothetical protein
VRAARLRSDPLAPSLSVSTVNFTLYSAGDPFNFTANLTLFLRQEPVGSRLYNFSSGLFVDYEIQVRRALWSRLRRAVLA